MAKSRAIWLLFGCQTLLSGGLSLSFPFFALYLHRDRGVSMAIVGACLSISFLTTAFGQGLGGELSDIAGRRRTMLAGVLGRTVLVAALGGAMLLDWPVWILFLFHFGSSMLGNLYDPAARSWIADRTNESERVRAYGLLRIAENVGWAVGPALGGFLAEASYPLLFLATAGVCALGTLALYLGIDESHGALRSEGFRFAGILGAADDRRFLRFCLFMVLLGVVMSQLVVSLSMFAVEYVRISEGQVGLLFSLNGLLVVALQYPISAWWERFRLTTSLAVGAVLYAAGWLAVGFSSGFAHLSLAMVVVTLGEMTVSPAIMALPANMAPAKLKGRYQGFAGMTRQLGMSFGPLSGGFGLQHLSALWAPAHWVGVAALGLAAAGGFLRLRSFLTIREEGYAETPPDSPARTMPFEANVKVEGVEGA